MPITARQQPTLFASYPTRLGHHCHATGCQTRTKPEMLMCYPHWNKVPRHIQRRVWSNYREGQCDDWKPSSAYCEAARDAVIAVARLEGKEPDTKLYDYFLRAKV